MFFFLSGSFSDCSSSLNMLNTWKGKKRFRTSSVLKQSCDMTFTLLFFFGYFCAFVNAQKKNALKSTNRPQPLPTSLYLFCDWPPPKSCGCGCERPPSPQQSASAASGAAGNAVAVGSTDTQLTAQVPPPWSLPPPEKAAEEPNRF